MIRIFQNREDLSLGAAELFVRCAREAVGRLGKFSVALSGGHTPRRAYELLALPRFRDKVSWDRTDVFWGDERCVSQDDHRNNFTMSFQTLLNHVPIPQERIHPIVCDGNPDQGSAQYESLLRIYFVGRPLRFDLVFLGLGENGHTASLFPGTAALHMEKRAVTSVHVEGEDFYRVPLTAPTINKAAVVAFLVSGISKAGVLRDIIDGPRDPKRLPARFFMSPTK